MNLLIGNPYKSLLSLCCSLLLGIAPAWAQEPIIAAASDLKFALEDGFRVENLLTPESEKAWKEWLKTSNYDPMTIPKLLEKSNQPGQENNHDTIGMVAMDAKGNLSGACTTSGLAFKMHGRVGDSPIIGAGVFVDNEIGSAISTGVGEEVIRIVEGRVDFLASGEALLGRCLQAGRVLECEQV